MMAATTGMAAVIDRSVAEHERVAATLPGGGADWMVALRRAALARFRAEGLPTLRDEAWRYTSLAGLESRSFETVTAPPELAESVLAPHLLAPDLARIVLVDGRHVPSLSNLPPAASGIHVQTLSQALDESPGALEPLLGQMPTAPRGLAALNAAFMSDGLVLRLEEGAVLETPLYVIHVTRHGRAPTAAYLRHVIQAGRGARATVIEHYVAEPEAEGLVSALVQADLAEGSAIEHYRLNEQSMRGYLLTATHVRQQRDSRFRGHAVDAGGRIGRNEVHGRLEGPGAECAVDGLYLGTGRQTLDNFIEISHLAPHCRSDQLFRGVLDGRSRGVFNGNVIVAREAVHTDGQQMNNNLLLSDNAEADSRPQLTIFTDDVKCSHGSTVGQLDADALFYLRTRGLGEDEARAMLVRAFAEKVVARIGEERVRHRIGRIVDERLIGSRPAS